MSGLPRWAAILLPAAVLGGCGWFTSSAPSPVGSLSDAVRTSEARATPRVIPRVASMSSRAPDSADVLDRVVAVVNNEAITLSELQEHLAQYLAENRQSVPREGESALRERLLQRLVEHRLQLQEARRDKIAVEEGEITEQLADVMKRMGVKGQGELERVVSAQGLTMESLRQRLREQIMIKKVIRRRVALRISVTEHEIDRYLLENRAKLETGLAFHARHILITPASPAGEQEWEAARLKAEEVWSMLRAGQDFAELARKYSQDPSAPDGGDLGVMKQGELAPEIEAQILRVRQGEVSGPFRSKLGYHMFKLEWKESLSGEALAQTKQQIRDILYRENYQERLEAWLQEIKGRAIIEIRL